MTYGIILRAEYESMKAQRDKFRQDCEDLKHDIARHIRTISELEEDRNEREQELKRSIERNGHIQEKRITAEQQRDELAEALRSRIREALRAAYCEGGHDMKQGWPEEPGEVADRYFAEILASLDEKEEE